MPGPLEHKVVSHGAAKEEMVKAVPVCGSMVYDPAKRTQWGYIFIKGIYFIVKR